MISNTFNFLLTLKYRPIHWRTLCILCERQTDFVYNVISFGLKKSNSTINTPITIAARPRDHAEFTCSYPDWYIRQHVSSW